MIYILMIIGNICITILCTKHNLDFTDSFVFCFLFDLLFFSHTLKD